MKRRVTMMMLAALMAVSVFAQGPGQGQGGPGQGPRGGQQGQGGMRMAPGGGMAFFLLLQRDVQTELKMTATQVDQIQKLLAPGAPGGPQGGQRGGTGQGQGQGQGGQRGGAGQGQGQGGQRGGAGQGQGQGGQRGGFGGSPEEQQRIEREVTKILNAGQFTRFEQLSLQRRGPTAMLDPKVSQKLGLSQQQLDQMRKILEENRPQFGGPGGPGRGQGGQRGGAGQGQGQGGQRGGAGQGQGNFEEMRKQMEAQREELNKKLLAVLTSNQRNTWNSMLGQPFKFQQPGFGGGPGGPGGQGGRGGRGGGGGGK